MRKLLKLIDISAKGQSLVEMAIVTPLLIFMLIGVFEVGWILRSYLVLVNVNREITRYAVRPGYLNFSSQQQVITSYTHVRDWALTSLSGQLEMDFRDTGLLTDTGNTTLIISHLVIDTGLPCEDIMTNPGNCDCKVVAANPAYTNTFNLDDLVVSPDLPGMGYQQGIFGPLATKTGSRATHINYTKVVSDLILENNGFNCELIKKGGLPSSNNVIITELFFDQPQLFGFPLISNPYTDPVPLYTHTTMRIVGSARSSGQVNGDLTANIDTIGPICNVFPFAVRYSHVVTATIGQEIDILDGNGNPDYGWLAWNPAKTGQTDLKRELTYAAISLNDFKDPDTADSILGVGNKVTSLPSKMDVAEIRDLVNYLVGKKIRVPLWNNFNGGKYQIPIPAAPGDPAFIWVQISTFNLANSEVKALYLGNASTECP